ncbi:MAG: hypothetical protein KUG77_29325 [Nannocystaceae bacterium]|nr:hypothetical protein [Nannocystaceae bacterium]
MPRDDPETHVPAHADEVLSSALDPGVHGVGIVKRVLLLASLVGCGSSPMAAAVPIFGDRDAESISLEGTLEAISFQNINKAKGKFTYNVELRISHEGISGSPHEADHAPGDFLVRVHKVYWSQLDAAEQAALAAGGPQHTMNVERWRDYAVGERVTLEVATWGPGRGAPRAPAAGLPTAEAP